LAPSSYTYPSCRLIFTGLMFFTLKNQITERTSQTELLVIDMVLHKALRHSNLFTQWFGGHWVRGKRSDDSSRSSKSSSQWSAWVGCGSGFCFRNDHVTTCRQDMHVVVVMASGWVKTRTLQCDAFRIQGRAVSSDRSMKCFGDAVFKNHTMLIGHKSRRARPWSNKEQFKWQFLIRQ
jgi:hypothetical protein